MDEGKAGFQVFVAQGPNSDGDKMSVAQEPKSPGDQMSVAPEPKLARDHMCSSRTLFQRVIKRL